MVPYVPHRLTKLSYRRSIQVRTKSWAVYLLILSSRSLLNYAARRYGSHVPAIVHDRDDYDFDPRVRLNYSHRVSLVSHRLLITILLAPEAEVSSVRLTLYNEIG